MRTRTLVVALAVMIAVGLFAALPAQHASANYGSQVHCMKYGETLYGVAYMYGTSAHAIAQYNGLWNPNYVRAGRCLRIPSGYGYGGYTNAGYGYTDYKKPAVNYGYGGYGYTDYKKPAVNYGHGGYGYGKSYGGKYCVRYGDTLSSIAWRHGTSAWAIANANGLWNPNHIKAGQCLTIPGAY